MKFLRVVSLLLLLLALMAYALSAPTSLATPPPASAGQVGQVILQRWLALAHQPAAAAGLAARAGAVCPAPIGPAAASGSCPAGPVDQQPAGNG